MNFRGSGCSDGNADINLTPDGRITMHTIYMVASSGADRASSERTKICNVDVRLSYRPKTQFAVFMSEIQGDVDLKQGVTAKQITTVDFVNDYNTRQVSSYDCIAS